VPRPSFTTHVTGGITIDVEQQPGGTTDDFTDRIAYQIIKALELSGLGTSSGQGVMESPFLHGASF